MKDPRRGDRLTAVEALQAERAKDERASGGDIGIPLVDEGATLIPQNVLAFGTDLDIPVSEVQLYLAVRELAHARLFRHAKWLRLQLMSSITEFARGIHIDTDRLEQLAEEFDPQNPEELRDAMIAEIDCFIQ